MSLELVLFLFLMLSFLFIILGLKIAQTGVDEFIKNQTDYDCKNKISRYKKQLMGLLIGLSSYECLLISKTTDNQNSSAKQLFYGDCISIFNIIVGSYLFVFIVFSNIYIYSISVILILLTLKIFFKYSFLDVSRLLLSFIITKLGVTGLELFIDKFFLIVERPEIHHILLFTYIFLGIELIISFVSLIGAIMLLAFILKVGLISFYYGLFILSAIHLGLALTYFMIFRINKEHDMILKKAAMANFIIGVCLAAVTLANMAWKLWV